jgi:DivIVA domain-containing protein
MATVFLVLVVFLVLAALILGVISLLAGDDPGLSTAEPDGRARPLPNNRSLTESDLKEVRFDVTLRGYRMAQVDRVLRRTAYDLGYKDEMIAVLEAEVAALRDGRIEDAELLRKARESAANPAPSATAVDQRSSYAAPSDFAPSGTFARSSEPARSDFAPPSDPTSAGDPTSAPASAGFDPTAPGTLARRTQESAFEAGDELEPHELPPAPAAASDDTADRPAPESATAGQTRTESDQDPAERSARA